MFGLAVNVVSQVLGIRASLPLLKSIVFGFVLGFAALCMVHGGLYFGAPTTFQGREFLATLVTNTLIYSALAYCYFHFLNLGETARRIRILRELHDAKGGLTMEEVLLRYNSKNMVAMRLGRLLSSGQVRLVNNRYVIKSPLLLMSAKIIAFLKLIILGRNLGEG